MVDPKLLELIEDLYEKYGKVMFWWHLLTIPAFICVVAVGMSGLTRYALGAFLGIPWLLLMLRMAWNHMLFGSNRDELAQLSADEVAALLESVGEPLHYREIHQRLGEVEIRDCTDHARGLSLLYRKDPRFYRPDQDVYGLIEWQEAERAANAVVALLDEVGEPLHYREIHWQLAERGLQEDGADPDSARTLLSRIKEDPRLYRPLRDTDTYGLVEWQEIKHGADAVAILQGKRAEDAAIALQGERARDAVVALLKEAGEPLPYREIHQKLEDFGLRLGGESPDRVAALLVKNDPRLYRPRQDIYGLVEWREESKRAADEAVALQAKRASDVVVALLKEVGEPLHFREIHQKVAERGLRVDGADDARELSLLFRNDPRVHRHSWATYGLVEWQESKAAADTVITHQSKPAINEAAVLQGEQGADAVVALLKDAGEPLHYREIHQRLIERGLRLDGGGPARATIRLVQSDPRLYSLSWDTHGLVEWRESKRDSAPGNVDAPLRRSRESSVSRSQKHLLQDARRYAPLSGPLEVAYDVLRAEERPLHYAELADRMLATGKWTTEAKSPASVLNSQISTHIRRHGEKSLFIRAARGVYGLR